MSEVYIYIYLCIIRVGGQVKYTIYVRQRAEYPAREGTLEYIYDLGIIREIRSCIRRDYIYIYVNKNAYMILELYKKIIICIRRDWNYTRNQNLYTPRVYTYIYIYI